MGFAALSVVTRHLRDALQLVDIRVLDHLIVAGDQGFKTFLRKINIPD
jgi:DNA repair protein RadC